MRKLNSHILPALICCLTLISCARPVDGFAVIPVKSSGDGIFNFSANLDDTTAVYSTHLAARIESSRISGADTTVAMDIIVKSPSGDVFAERVSFPLRQIEGVTHTGRSGNGTVDIEWPYRDSIRVGRNEAGLWSITVQPADRHCLEFITGIGFSYNRH